MSARKLINYWISKDRSRFYTAAAVLFIIFYILGLLFGNYGMTEISARFKLAGFIGFVVLVTVYFVHKNLNAYYRFLELFKDTDHLPIKQISYVNSFCMTVFLIAAIIGILVTAYALEPLWRAIAEWFANRPVVEIPAEPMELNPMPTPPPMPSMQELAGEIQDPGPPPAWVAVLNALIEYGGMLLILVICFFALRKGAGKMLDFITRPRHFDEDEKVYLKPTLDILMHIAPPEAEEEQPKKGLRYFLSYEARIRRFYKKKILTGRKRLKCAGAPAEWASPRELEQSAGLDDAALHCLYEKARYSHMECTEGDWKVLENAARNADAADQRNGSV